MGILRIEKPEILSRNAYGSTDAFKREWTHDADLFYVLIEISRSKRKKIMLLVIVHPELID